MKIWFDADNGPHVLIMKPLAREQERRGHRVVFTARDRTRTCELLDLYGLAYRRVGGDYGRGLWNKVRGTLGRAARLAAAMRGAGCQVSFGHGSRALPVASRLLGIPTVTMYDYEWVDPRLFNLCCRAILLPAAVPSAQDHTTDPLYGTLTLETGFTPDPEFRSINAGGSDPVAASSIVDPAARTRASSLLPDPDREGRRRLARFLPPPPRGLP